MGIIESLNIEVQFKKAYAYLNNNNTLAAIQIYQQLLKYEESERKSTIKALSVTQLFGFVMCITPHFAPTLPMINLGSSKRYSL